MRVPFVDLQAHHEPLRAELDAAVAAVGRRGDFILGAAVEAFEREFAGFIGTRHAVGVASGLSAIELALRAYGVGAGDEVITAANTFVATVMAILATGATPKLVDADASTYTMDPAALASAITPRTRAIIPVHLYGQPADLDRIVDVAARHNLLVIEDAAQAHGARYRGRHAGTFGHAAAFSFYPSKNLGAWGDAGMVVTDDRSIADRIVMLRNVGQRAKYLHALTGTNARLDTLQAAVLSVKLPHLDSWNAARRAHADRYRARLDGRVHLPVAAPDREHIYHLFVVEVDRRGELQQRLKAAEIDTAIHYPVPVHLQEACTSLGYRRGEFPVTEVAADRILSLPMYPEITDAQIDFVSEMLLGALQP